METQPIHISRNVVFHEDIFPFAGKSDASPDFFSMFDSPPVLGNPLKDQTLVDVREQSTSENTDMEPSDSVADDSLTVDKEKRVSKPPGYLHDYNCNVTATDIPHPLAPMSPMRDLLRSTKHIFMQLQNLQSQQLSIR